MEKKEYHYEESPFLVSRREFVTITGIVVALLALPVVIVRQLASARKDYVLARTRGLYRDDEKSPVRVSHASQAIAQYYRDFGGQPLGRRSEELLHTKYIDRTKGLPERRLSHV